MRVRIGFTGSQEGMAPAQERAARPAGVAPGAILHHGDCIGADAQAHDIAVELGCGVVIQPPAVGTLPGFKPCF